MPLGLGRFLDQIVTLLLLIAAVLGGIHLYKTYVNPAPPAGASGYSVPLTASPASGAAPTRVTASPPHWPAAETPGASQVLLTRTSRIKQWNYGPAGAVNGFLLNNGMLAIVPPDLGAQLRSQVRTGSEVTVTGYRSVGNNNLEIISVQSVTVNGQTLGVVRGNREP